MEQIKAYQSTVFFQGSVYDVIMLLQNAEYNLYICPSDGSIPMHYMFSVSSEENSAEEAMDLGVNNASDYIDDLLSE